MHGVKRYVIPDNSATEIVAQLASPAANGGAERQKNVPKQSIGRRRIQMRDLFQDFIIKVGVFNSA